MKFHQRAFLLSWSPAAAFSFLLAIFLAAASHPVSAGVIDYAGGFALYGGEAQEIIVPAPETDLIEDAEPPLEIDWDEMEAVNPDIIGYLYIDGMPNISYPILYSGDNDFYLHHNLHKEEAYKGSIFLEGLNTPDFADPNCLIYGHNMADGTMFGSLKYLNSQELYDEHPYFWILTKNGNYRYKIFSMFHAEVGSDVFSVYGWHGPQFKEWEEKWQKKSEVAADVPLTTMDYTVCMTTCTSDRSMRFVVFGKCVSSEKPYREVDLSKFVEILTRIEENESEVSAS